MIEVVMKQYDVTGMSCAACSARVEKAVMSVEGVESCSVSLLTNSMGVEGNADPDKIIAAVKKAGYGASERQTDTIEKAYDSLEDTETPKLIKRLVISAAFLIALMYISMGHMLGAYLPPFLEGVENSIYYALVQIIFTLPIIIINFKYFSFSSSSSISVSSFLLSTSLCNSFIILLEIGIKH